MPSKTKNQILSYFARVIHPLPCKTRATSLKGFIRSQMTGHPVNGLL